MVVAIEPLKDYNFGVEEVAQGQVAHPYEGTLLLTNLVEFSFILLSESCKFPQCLQHPRLVLAES